MSKKIRFSKKILVSLLSAVIFFTAVYSPYIQVFASSGSDQNIIDRFNDKLHDITQSLTGVILAPVAGGKDAFRQWLGSHKNDYGIGENETPDDFIGNNYSYENGNNYLSVNLSNAIIDYTKNYINSNYGYEYGYSFSSDMFINSFDSQVHYDSLVSLLTSNQGKVILRNSSDTIFVLDTSDIIFLLKSYSPGSIYYNVAPTKNWSEQIGDSDNLIVKVYTWSNSANSYTYTNSYLSSGRIWSLKTDIDVPMNNSVNSTVISLNTEGHIIYKSLEALKAGSEGIQGYYVTDSYNNYSHVNNSQTITDNSFHDNPTYNDVNNYINSYYVTNQSWPTTNQITQYINNYYYDSDDGGSGGGSDNEDDEGFDWGFLDVIADFIRGLLSSLKTVLSGIVDVLTEVIDIFIGTEDPDTGERSGGLPNIIGQLINYFMPFLPSWVGTLIGLSILLYLILGVINYLRK